MEAKKGVFQQQNQPQTQQVLGRNVVHNNESIQNKQPVYHQHNIAPPHHLRLLQYGLKIPNHQHHQINQQQQQQLEQYYGQSQYNALPATYHVHQLQHQSHYQNTPSLLEHPQIWMPPQQLVHYHQPQPKVEQPKSQNAVDEQKQLLPKPQFKIAKEVVERKKSSGSNVQQQLRSPIAKRPLEAPVTMQGWLHKQGSEGLMLWKKRWFVLCDYCLFYYKGPEEEKLLGSILLPSYKVSVCCPEDKICKKFAFKCEHANMRTYVLAADSQELMFQWIRVLNMACLLQTNNESDKQSGQSSSSLHKFAENTNLGYHQQFQNVNSPVHVHSSSNTTDTTNQELGQFNQPLYANAPPKPRRLTDGAYSSPSPDIIDNRYLFSDPNSKFNNSYGTNVMCKSPISMYSHNGMQYTYPFGRENVTEVVERRTPDTYGRSKLNSIKLRTGGDYEDIYGDEHAMYKRPTSPITYTNIKKTNSAIQQHYNPSYVDIHLRKQHNNIPRPHSADFLEYEVKYRKQEKPSNASNSQRPARPKSSLDINRYSPNDYFYSEERYAEKMRKSAQYFAPNISKFYGTNVHHDYRLKHLENESGSGGGGTFPLTRSSTQPISFENTSLRDYANRNLKLELEQQAMSQPVRSRSVLSEGSLTKELYDDFRLNARENEREQMISPLTIDKQREEQKYIADHLADQFKRSASARLTRTTPTNERHFQDEKPYNSRDGERKREESMKRLLEWKQRMLQSPLNRKLSSNNTRTKAIDERSIHHYNSYSSDDEDYEDRSRKRAGRTMENVSSPKPALSASTTVFNLAEPSSVLNDKENENNQLAKPLKITNSQLLNTAHISSLRSEYTDQFQDVSIMTEIKSNGALVKSILAEFEKKTTNTDTQKNIPTLSTNAEENYMTMTPKKSILDPSITEVEESSYVEMTQGVNNLSLLNPNNETQPYEIVCFTEGRMEPVYMELSSENSEHKKELPDILNESSNNTNKSDSSDADDEASKDFTPCHPNRFSLSDTFRPASYYLGATMIVPEFQDSSDSELVSPPPIPVSPPPIYDFDQQENPNEDFNFAEQSKKDNKTKVRKKDEDSSSLFSEDSVDLRLSTSMSSKYERMLKCRPVSKEFYDELESLDSRYDESVDNIDLDKYLKELEITTLSNNESCFHDYENLCIINKTEDKSDDSGTITSVKFTDRAASSMSNRDNKASPISYLSPTLISAPYYYSDLPANASTAMENDCSSIKRLTLNNQRSLLTIGNKRDIMHIINPIGCNTNNSAFKLAAEARSVSADFLNLTDKSGHIDKKNIYESDTIKRIKTMQSTMNNADEQTYPLNVSTAKTFSSEEPSTSEDLLRRSHSLEGLLVCSLNDETRANSADGTNCADISSSERNETAADLVNNPATEGSHVWEEDSIWREQLRRVSQRHTMSLDDLLGSINNEKEKPSSKRAKPTRSSIIRGATYVNDSICSASKIKEDKDDANRIEKDKEENDKQYTDDKQQNNFVIDREKLRQWDLLSSAPSDDNEGHRLVSTVVESDAGVGLHTTCQPNTQTPSASGSVSLNCDTFPRMIHDKKLWNGSLPSQQARSDVNIFGKERNYYLSDKMHSSVYPPITIQYNKMNDYHSISRKAGQWSSRINFSAGELLGRTHEELVLLLIQLRRQSTNTCHAIESYYNEIENIQSQLNLMDAAKRLENLQKLEQIKQHLIELEKQYEKGKPLVNLVDNMVKLGSLYRTPADRNSYSHMRNRFEFNQQNQEKKLLDDERRDWNRLSPNYSQLQFKVQQLYQLDRLIKEESGALQNLQKDKEKIERALGGLRQRMNHGHNDPAEIEIARKQQAILENELSKVHLMLAENSKKLEETVAGNARLEHELLVLKQKLQTSKSFQPRNSPLSSNQCDSMPGVVELLELDLQKVQQKVGDLQRQRQELSMQVRQLTDKSSQQQLRPISLSSNYLNQGNVHNKKKMPVLWRETDLDTLNIIDHGDNEFEEFTPLYINTELKHNADTDYYERSLRSNDSTSEDNVQAFPQEKQEIKTVRIVKRESERRQRDREKTGQVKWDAVLEEDDHYLMQSKIQNLSGDKLPSTVKNGGSSSDNANASSILPADNVGIDKPFELSPVFKSEAARQIINEMSTDQSNASVSKSVGGRRTVPKEKRRHYTAPHNNVIKSLNELPTDDSAFNRLLVNSRRARDDLDMERALRQRIDTPDVVRSTLSNKEFKYNENTIDNILGTPNKISIPERYIPEKLPQLSAEEQQHRLRKVESIKKMLSDTAIISGSSMNLASTTTDEINAAEPMINLSNKATSKMVEEKRQREHLLQLNQILAKQVMEMSKIVAVKALATLPLDKEKMNNTDDDDLSPETPLPIYQQRDNFYS